MKRLKRILQRVRKFFTPVVVWIRRYLVSFLPAGHPVLEDDVLRGKLQILNGVSLFVILILVLRLPILYRASPFLGYLSGSLIVLFITGVAALVLLQARYFRTIAFIMILSGGLINLTVSHLSGRFPPITIPYLGGLIVALHFLIGRYASLVGLFFQISLFFLLDQLRNEGYVSSAEYISFWQQRFYANLIIGGLILWLFSEAFARSRDETERRLRAARVELERDLELARNMQTSLLPADITDGPYAFSGRMTPAVRVGGDYYDLIAHDGRHWVALGDVTGHGLQAGMLVMQARGLLRHFVQDHGPGTPEEIFVSLNNSFYESIRGLAHQSFMTFVLMRFCPSGEVLYAGRHLNFYVHRRQTGRLEEFVTRGAWLGVHPIDRSESGNLTGSLRLNAGDTLLAYTDGCTEAENEFGKRFGADRLAAAFQSEIGCEDLREINRALEGEIFRFTGKNQPDDDLTLLTIRRLV